MYFEILICVNLVKEDKRTREHGFLEDMRTEEHVFWGRHENRRTWFLGKDMRTEEHGFGKTREHGFLKDRRT